MCFTSSVVTQEIILSALAREGLLKLVIFELKKNKPTNSSQQLLLRSKGSILKISTPGVSPNVEEWNPRVCNGGKVEKGLKTGAPRSTEKCLLF